MMLSLFCEKAAIESTVAASTKITTCWQIMAQKLLEGDSCIAVIRRPIKRFPALFLPLGGGGGFVVVVVGIRGYVVDAAR